MALYRSGMAGTDPRIKSGDGHDVRVLIEHPYLMSKEKYLARIRS